MEYAVGSATVANSWSGYFQSVLSSAGFSLPNAIAGSPFRYNAGTGMVTYSGGVVNLPAVLITLVVSGVIIKG